MTYPVKPSDIIEGLAFQSDEGQSYLHTATGEVVYLTDQEVRAAEKDAPLEDFPRLATRRPPHRQGHAGDRSLSRVTVQV